MNSILVGNSKVLREAGGEGPLVYSPLNDSENIPLTNNHAEQQIRHYVVYRKNSYFTQSERGNTFLERIISLYLTWKQRGFPKPSIYCFLNHSAERIL